GLAGAVHGDPDDLGSEAPGPHQAISLRARGVAARQQAGSALGPRQTLARRQQAFEPRLVARTASGEFDEQRAAARLAARADMAEREARQGAAGAQQQGLAQALRRDRFDLAGKIEAGKDRARKGA